MRIAHIKIEGNYKTRAEIIQQEMPMLVGDKITPQLLEASRQAIMDLGLFEKVSLFESIENNEAHIVVKLKEKKHDWYILPRLDRNGEGDITVGLNWRENNLNGLNQRLRTSLIFKKFEDAKKEEEFKISTKFIYPRIVNTQLSTYIYAHASEVSLEEIRKQAKGKYLRDEYTAGIGIGQWFARSGTSKGLHADVGLEYSRFKHEHLGGQAGFFKNLSISSLIVNLDYKQVQDYRFSRQGFATGLRLQKASEVIGSDREFFYKQLYFKHYQRLPFKKHANFNLQFQLGSGDQSIFGDAIYELSGNKSLRGYPREALEGNAFALLNSEFLMPLMGKNNVRGVILFDAGNVYSSLSEIKDLDFEYSLGLGIRWKFKQWVNTELRIDVARGLGDEGVTRVYLSSEATF